MHAVARRVHGPFPYVYSCTVRTIIGALVRRPRVVRSRAPDSGSRITGHGSIQRETPMHNLRYFAKSRPGRGAFRKTRVFEQMDSAHLCPIIFSLSFQMEINKLKLIGKSSLTRPICAQIGFLDAVCRKYRANFYIIGTNLHGWKI